MSDTGITTTVLAGAKAPKGAYVQPSADLVQERVAQKMARVNKSPARTAGASNPAHTPKATRRSK